MKNFTKIKLVIIFTMFVTTINAKVWHINNSDNTAHFKELQAAHNDSRVIAGDTLYVDGSTVSYAALICSKRLVIFGPGYFISDNSSQANSLPATITDITLNAGSDGSVIMGMTISRLSINSNNANIERNNLPLVYINSCSGLRVVSNYIQQIFNSNSAFSGTNFNNNFVGNHFYMVENSQFSTFNNNILNGTPGNFRINAATFRNNIFTYSTQNIANPPIINSGSITNNISQVKFFDDNNIVTPNITALFIGGSSRDGKYKLAESSAAKGAGFNGTDCGIFGGNYPYILGGIPPVPVITKLEVDDTANTQAGLKVKMTVTSY